MTNSEAKELVDDVFEKITSSDSIDQIKELKKDDRIKKNWMSTENYPMITFKITTEEISYLKNEGKLTDALQFTNDLPSKINDPLTKILYALAWKNGDLPKIKHILRGINDADSDDKPNEEAVVFHQFGKYLTKRTGEPIIDQHVIRAFAIKLAKKNDDEELGRWRKLSELNKDHVYLIAEYKKWLKDGFNNSLKAQEGYAYHIDLVLFALGKTIKDQNKKLKKSDRNSEK